MHVKRSLSHLPDGAPRQVDRSVRGVPFATVCRRLCLLILLCAAGPSVARAAPSHRRGAAGSASPAARPNLAPVRVSDPRFGVVQAYQAPADAAMIGVRWERISFWWKEMQPNGPNSWNAFATGHDRVINREVRAGRQIVGLLINTPDWAAVNPAQHGDAVPKGLYLPYNDPRNYWGHFVGLMARHYASRINDWIIWNEVDISHGSWHTWAGSRADYARLVEVAYLAARAANPRARIILAGDPYWYDHGAWFTDLLHRLTTAPGARAHHAYFDAANLHLYSRPTDLVPIITQYRRLLARAGLHKPLWVAETNAIPYDDPARRYPRAGFFASLADQASYIIQAFALDLALGVRRIEVNRMTDGSDFTAGGEPFGLVRNNGTVRPAFYAYRTVAMLFADVTAGHIAVDARTGAYEVTLYKPGAVITVAWDQRPLAASVSIPAIAGSATLVNKYGATSQVEALHGRYQFALAPATGNTDTANPKDYVIGGSPIILMQAVR